MTSWIVSESLAVQIILDILAEDKALVEGEAKLVGVQVEAVMADGITLVFSQLLIFRVDSLLEVE